MTQDAKAVPVIDASDGVPVNAEQLQRTREAAAFLRHTVVALGNSFGTGSTVDALVTVTTQLLVGLVGEAEAIALLRRVIDRVPEMALAMRETEGSA